MKHLRSITVILLSLCVLFLSSFSHVAIQQYIANQANALTISPNKYLLGSYHDWTVEKIGEGNQCEISNSMSNRDKGRTFEFPIVTVMINSRRYDESRNFVEIDEIFITVGDYLQTEGNDNKIAKIYIDGEQFLLATDGDIKRMASRASTRFWTRMNPQTATGETLVNAMKAGDVMTVREVSDASVVAERTVSLIGFTKAYQTALTTCPRLKK